MKIKSIIILILLSILSAKADYKILCPYESIKILEKESSIKKFTGLNFLSKKIAETIIQKELNEELNSNINANLQIYTINRLKNGEFKGLSLKSNQIKYKAFSMSDFYAETICNYNKVIYTKKRVYYPTDLPFKYKGIITNEDINNVINSKYFQKELNRISLKLNNLTAFSIKSPLVKIEGDKLYFNIPVKTIFGNINLKFKAELEVKSNKIILKDITFNSKNNIINNNMISSIMNEINPIAYEIKSLNGKYCKIIVTEAKIKNGQIQTQGIFIINKNQGTNE